MIADKSLYYSTVLFFNPGRNLVLQEEGMVDLRGIEPLIPACKAGVLPLALQTHIGACGWIRTNYLRDMSPPLIHMSFTGKKIIWSPTKDSNPHCLIRSQVSCPVRRMGEMGAKAGFEPAISNL